MKRQLEACIFDASSHHDPSRTIILQLARHWLLFFENHKIDPLRLMGRPGGMRGGAGGRLEGGLRSADLRFAITVLWLRFDTPALAIRQGRRIQALRAFRRARLRSTSNENRRTKIEQDKTGCSGEAVF